MSKNALLVLTIILAALVAVGVFSFVKRQPAEAPGSSEVPVPALKPEGEQQGVDTREGLSAPPPVPTSPVSPSNELQPPAAPSEGELDKLLQERVLRPAEGVPQKPEFYTVEIYDDRFAPSQIKIETGGKVVFVNRGKSPHWPASDVHPTHTLCPGFDALRGLQEAESYEAMFSDKKTCPFHDHLKPSLKGSVVVE